MTANNAKTRKAKGVRLENLVVKMLNEAGISAKRMPKSGALKDFKSDIYTDMPISIECKNQENWSIHTWWKQCEKDAGDSMPILVMARNRQEPMAYLKFSDLVNLLKETN
jgi:hypothetical protein